MRVEVSRKRGFNGTKCCTMNSTLLSPQKGVKQIKTFNDDNNLKPSREKNAVRSSVANENKQTRKFVEKHEQRGLNYKVN